MIYGSSRLMYDGANLTAHDQIYYLNLGGRGAVISMTSSGFFFLSVPNGNIINNSGVYLLTPQKL